jgi:hypothetical protein
MIYTINVGGVSREMTAEEISELKEAQSLANKIEEADKVAIAKIEADKVSGNSKLKGLGLTDDEISALVG